MISYLIGTIHNVFENSFIIEVQGVGYEVFASAGFLQKVRPGEEAEVYIHHHIREDNQSLYGFETLDERQLFKKLLSVNGVGPKSALAALSAAPLNELIRAIQLEDHSVFQSVSGIGPRAALGLLSTFSPEQLASAIIGGNEDIISQVPGIGKKTAARIVLELKGKLEKGWAEVAAPALAQEDSDAVAALTSLGYSLREATQAVSSLPTSEKMELEDKVRLALQQLAKHSG